MNQREPRITILEVKRAVPNGVSAALPPSWQPDLAAKKSVFNQFYALLVSCGFSQQKDFYRLHERVFVGDRLGAKLHSWERKRLSRMVPAAELDRSLMWSDLDAGPRSRIGEAVLVGDSIFILPDGGSDGLDKLVLEVSRRAQVKSIAVAKRRAAGPNFWLWLKSQAGRDDPVGDLLVDAERDAGFPRDATDFDTIACHLGGPRSNDPVVRSLRMAWGEYIDQHPERGLRRMHCDRCADWVRVDAAALVFDDDLGDLLVLHSACAAHHLATPRDVSLTMDGISWSVVEVITDRCEATCSMVAELEDRMRMAGVLRPGDGGDGWIYFIQATDTGNIKVGFTTRTVEDRIREMQTGHPAELRILARVRGNRKLEAEIHDKYSANHVRGEWFRPHPELMSYIALLPGVS